MQRYTITKGATSQIILVSVYDSSSSTGGKLTGLVYNSAGLTAYYYREGAGTGATAITLATATLGTYTSGGFIAIDGTNMPGDYELHLPTAVLASGADRVLIQLKGATNMVPVNIEIDLIDLDLRTALPSNFSSMVISAGGAVDSLVQGFLNTLITETTAGRLSGNLSTLLDNGDAAATLTLDAIALAATVATAAELAKVPKSDGSTTWNATALAQIVNGILDEALTAGTHNVANSLARRIRAIQEYGGYEGGAVWIDTVNGTTGTTDYENGTVVFPCDTIANANTIATSIGLSNFIIIPGSSITFAASQISQVFNGTAWTLALGGQDISNTAIKGCQSVTGIAITPTGEAHFYDCEINTTTLGQVHLKQCGLSGTITLSAAAVYTITASYSQTNTAPIIDFGAAVGSSEVDFVGWNGDIELQNMGQLGTDLVRWHGTGEITINANCVGGTLHVYGSPEITDNSGGAVTISYDDDTTDIKAILVDTGTTIPALITALNNVSTADVLTQINAALDTAIAELGVGAPAATPSLRTGLMLLYMMARNRVDVDTTGTDALKIYNDAGTQIASKTITDDGTDYSEAEMA